MQGEWALIHSKHTENMPPQLVEGVCGCWLPKLTLTTAGAPCAWPHPSPRAHSGSALNTRAPAQPSWDARMLCPPW